MKIQCPKIKKIKSKPKFKIIRRRIRARLNRTGRPKIKKGHNDARRNHAKAYFRALQAYYNSFSISILMTYKKMKPNHQKNPQYIKDLMNKILNFVGDKMTFIEMLSALMRHRFPKLDECLNASFDKDFLNQACTRTLRSALVQLRKKKGLNAEKTLKLSFNQMKSLYIACVLVRGIGIVQIDQILQNMLTSGDSQYFQSSWTSIMGQLLLKTKLLTKDVFDRIVFDWDKVEIMIISSSQQQLGTINQANDESQNDSYPQKEDIKGKIINEQEQKVQEKQKFENNNRVIWYQQIQQQNPFQRQHQQLFGDGYSDSYNGYFNLSQKITYEKIQSVQVQVNRFSNTKRVQKQNKIISEEEFKQQINYYQHQLQQRLRGEQEKNEKAEMIKRAEIAFNYGKVNTRKRNSSAPRYVLQQHQIEQQQIEQEVTHHSIQQISLQESQIQHLEQYHQNPNRKVPHKIRQIDTLVRYILQQKLVIADAIANHIYSACKSQNVQITF